LRRIETKQLKPNMVVARSVSHGNTNVLAQAGMVLTVEAIKRLTELGIAAVYIREQYVPETIEPEHVIPDILRLETVALARANLSEAENYLKLDLNRVADTVNSIIDELLASDDIVVQLTGIRAFDDCLFTHSVNVCVLSIVIGISLNYNKSRLIELGVGALLHDIGKTRISPAILNKPDDLTRRECEQVKRHTTYGFEMLRNCAELSLLSAHIAFQHHERWDGQGYPRGLRGELIHEYARIVAVADVYAALLADRPYRPAYTVNQALNILERMTGVYLDPRPVSALVSNIAVYPVGSLVEINTGCIGMVMEVNKAAPTRPVIRIMVNNSGRQLKRTRLIDLSKSTTVMIVRALNDEDVDKLNLRQYVSVT
jgi:HD-GYP domain-containing protein (c-di-GMP phosphodiesterase class II)